MIALITRNNPRGPRGGAWQAVRQDHRFSRERCIGQRRFRSVREAPSASQRTPLHSRGLANRPLLVSHQVLQDKRVGGNCSRLRASMCLARALVQERRGIGVVLIGHCDILLQALKLCLSQGRPQGVDAIHLSRDRWQQRADTARPRFPRRNARRNDRARSPAPRSRDRWGAACPLHSRGPSSSPGS